jgi:hypothetical protein
LIPASILLIIYSAALLFGLALVGGAIYSLLRSFPPGSQKKPRSSTSRLLSRGMVYSLGLGLAVAGAVGLIAQLLFRTSTTVGLIWSIVAGALVALIALFLLVYLPSRGRAEEALLDFDAAGRRAEVVIAIPANGLGEVAFLDDQERINLGARSATGRAIPQGATVVIERVTRRIAVVSPPD